MTEEIQAYSEKALEVFDNLFTIAKEKSEFEYFCALIGFQGIKGKEEEYDLETIHESKALLHEFTHNFLNATLTLNTKARLGLLLYGHIVEMNHIYDLLGNMLCICSGGNYRYRVLTLKHKDNHSGKIKFLKDKSNLLGLNELTELIDAFYYPTIRHTFFHSNYLLRNDRYFATDGNKIYYAGKAKESIDLVTELLPILQKGLNFAFAYFKVLDKHYYSYNKEKRIIGSTDPKNPIKAFSIIPKKDSKEFHIEFGYVKPLS